SVEYLREAILDPNAKVAREYWVAKISLRNGATYSGFIMNEDTHLVQIIDFAQGLRSLPRSEFTSFEIDKKSIMPPYSGKLAAQEMNDLIGYLWSLRRQRGAE